MERTPFAQEIIQWYQKHHRDLPWRHTLNPYQIWLSEVILQQTRVAQGLPYYQKFVEAFPTVYDLASASEQEVLRLWQGLGYYSRARNLHACAKSIVADYDGEFPKTYQELLKLKGVGVYTAAAIASFAFNETVPVVDGNVYRVLSRVFGVEDDILSTTGQKNFRKLAEQLVPEGRANVYNQAIMEFGALQCTPANPACLLCPLSTMCYAYQHGKQKDLPVKIKKGKIKDRYLHYLVIKLDDKLLMKQRPAKGIWAGLYDFYLIETNQPQKWDELDDSVLGELMQQQPRVEKSELYQHQLSHQRLHVTFYTLSLNSHLVQEPRYSDGKFYSREEIEALPKPILIDNFLRNNYS
ncbi:A/G-specific adenine glycosylase [Tunicatimonas pelagia]|uniref:A/G-specific adenine glycosylase n=1 Tax=Tunicatimonas pelagia TaxID=931531 RepID=UPI0026650F5A|nr:A/G-specific adenine glycosylase [Tunicatimonas pelagia]WKN44546.1 A/G-specific adenine glycosylase [Tunicatimonas pelagia]